MRDFASAALAATILANPAFAQTPQALGAGTTHVPAQPTATVLADGSVVGPANPLPTRDANGAPVAGFVALTPGVAASPGRGVVAVCSGAGQATFVAPDGSSLAVPLQAGFNQFGFAVVQVAAGASTSCAYATLK
jgi:hypothetical protein